jgi:hypothetical protein
MYLLPIEIYLSLFLVIPLGVCFAKWKFLISWKVAVVICAALSWLYFNFWMMHLDPPDNGFANAVYFLTGWFWLLPVFGLFAAVFRLMENRLAVPVKSIFAIFGYKTCTAFTVMVLIWNVLGGMSADRALIEARLQLKTRGFEPMGREIPEYANGHWIVRYPDAEFREIRLTRNGKMLWIGGPG